MNLNPIHKRRLTLILLIITAVAIAAALALYALQQNINLFYSPSQVAAGQVPRNQAFRLGGIVQAGSVKHTSNSLQVVFTVTDNAKSVPVSYTGILPDLFREGQAVVVEGKLTAQGTLQADQVLAKHDEKYMPAAVKAMLKPVNIKSPLPPAEED